MDRLALVIVAALFAFHALADSSEKVDHFGAFLLMLDSEVYREYACRDRYEEDAEPYVFIVVSDKEADGMNMALVLIGDTPHIGAGYQQGLDYRIAFGRTVEDSSDYAVVIENSGKADFFNFTQLSSRTLTCERTGKLNRGAR